MSSVDNRVVKMTFDNSQFEKKVRDTINTLKEFDKSLKFDGASAGFNSLKNAADNLDMSAVGKKASDEAKRVKDASGEAAASISEVNSATQNVDFSSIGNSAHDAAKEVNNAASSVDLSDINTGAQDASQGFSIFEEVAIGALRRVGEQIEEFISGGLSLIGNKIKEFTLDPIVEGFKEYETQVGSIQTILANTGLDFDSDEDIGRVNAALDELNKYADDTIYKFTDMTEAIGTFTAAGLDLDDAVAAVKGVANVAAFSGAGATDVTRVLPQISQALSSGFVSLQDWRSIETAHMSSRGFVDTIGNIATHMASIGKASEAAGEAGQALVDHSVTMRQALNQQDNEAWAKWLTSDILSESLKVFTYDLRGATKEEEKIVRDHLAELGFQNKEEQDALLKQAEMATRAATEVRTWSQLWDTFGESIGSNWSGIWRNLIGDFKQSTDTFTFLSNTMSDGVNGLLGGIVNVSKKFNESGAIDLIFGGYKRYTKEDFLNGTILDENLIGKKATDAEGNLIRIRGALDNLIEAIGKPLGAIGQAFSEVFSISDDQLGETLVGLAMAFSDFTSTLIISDSAAESIKQIFEGLFSVLKIGFQIVADVGAAFFKLVDILRTFLDPALDIALSLFGQVGKIVKWVGDRFLEIRAAVIEMLQPVFTAIETIQYLISSFFGFVDIPGKINLVGDGLIGLLDILWQIVDLPGKIRFLGEVLGGIVNFIGDITGWNAAVAEVNKHFEETGEELSIVDVWLKRLLDNPIIGFFNSIKEVILNAFPPLRDFLNAMFSDPETRDNTLKSMWDNITTSIKDALGPLADFMSKTGEGLATVAGLLGRLFGAVGGFALKLGEAFLAWEPIQGVISKLNEFKDGAINFFLSLPDRIGNMVGGLSSSLGGVQGVFDGVFKWFEDTIQYFSTVSVDQFLSDLQSWGNGVIENVKGVYDYFANVDPSKLVDDFYKTITETIHNIDDAIIGFIGSTFDPIMGKEILTGYEQNIYGPCKEVVTSFGDWLGDIASRSSSIPEFFGNVFSSIRDIVSGKLGEIKSYFDNFDLKAVFNTAVSGLYDSASGIYGALYSVAENIEKTFPALSGVLTGGLENIKNGVKGFIDGIVNFFAPIVYTSKDIPDFFGKLFNAIGSKIREGIDHVIGIITSFTPQAFLENITNIGNVIHDTLVNWFPDLKPQIDAVSTVMGTFFSDITKDADNWGDVFLNVVGKIGEGLAEIPKMLSPVFETLANVVTDALVWLLDRLSTLPGPIGQFFGGLKDNLLNAKDVIVQNAKEFPIRFSEMFGSVGTYVDIALQNISRFWEGFGIQSIPDSAGGFVDNFKKFIGGKFDELSKFVMTLPDKFGGLVEKFQSIFNEETINKIVDVIQKVLIGKLIWSLADFVKGLGGLASGIGRYLKKDTWESFGEQFKKVGIALGILAASMYIISLIPDPQACANILWELAGMLVALDVVGSALNKFGLANSGDNLIKIAGSLGVLCLSLLAAMFTIQRLTEFDWRGNWPGIIAMIAAIGAMVGIGAFVKDGGANAMKIAGSIGILAISMRLLIPAIEALSALDPAAALGASLLMSGLIAAMAAILGVLANATNGVDIATTATSMLKFSAALGVMSYALYQLAQLDSEAVLNSAAAVGLLIAALGALVVVTGDTDLVKTSTGVLIFSAALGVMSYALYQLAQVDSEALLNASAAIGILVAALGALVVVTGDTDLVKTSAGVLIFSAAVGVMAYALYQLTQVDSEALLNSSAAIGILVAALGALVVVTGESDLIATAAGVVVFSAAVGIMAYALYQLSQVDTGALIAATACIGALIAVFGVLAVVLSSPGISEMAIVILPLLSIAFIALGAAALMIGEALNLAVDAITKLAAAGPILQQFVTIVSEHLLEFGAAAIGVAALGAGLFVLGAGLLVFGAGASAAGLGLTLLSTGIRDFLTLIADLPELLQNAGTTISDFFTHLPETIANIWNTFITWLTETVIPAIGGFLTSILGKLGEWLGQFWTWFTETALPSLGEALATFWNWFTTEGLPMLGNFIGEIFNKLGELLTMFWEWFTTQGLPAIAQAAQDFWNWVTTEGIPMLVNFIGEIMGKLGELLAQFGQWFQSEGLPAIVQAGADFWNWVTTEGIPMLLNFIGEIFKTLGDLLVQLGRWIISDGLPAVGKALADIMGEAGKLGGMLLDWAKGLPSHIMNGINSVWHMFTNAGEDIVRGIRDGVLNGVGWIVNAVQSLGHSALNAIKSFFGIASPSKLMANEVGPYIDEGLAEGIANNSGTVYDSMYNVGASGATGLNDGLNSGMGDVQNTLNTSFKSFSQIAKEHLAKYPNDLQKAMQGAQQEYAKQQIMNAIRKKQQQESKSAKPLYSGSTPNTAEIESEIADRDRMRAEKQAARDREREAEMANRYRILSEEQELMEKERSLRSMDVASESLSGSMGNIDLSKYMSSLETPSVIPTIDDSNMPQYSHDFLNPSIAPVIDMSKFDLQTGDMNSTIQSVMDQGQFNFGMDNKINEMINMPSFGFNDSINNQSKMFDDKISGLNDKLGSLEQMMSSKLDSLTSAYLSGHDIYMDSGVLVGAIAPQMDDVLGQRQSFVDRGLII